MEAPTNQEMLHLQSREPSDGEFRPEEALDNVYVFTLFLVLLSGKPTYPIIVDNQQSLATVAEYLNFKTCP